MMGWSRPQEFVAGAITARAAVVHRRIPLLESDEQNQIDLLRGVGVTEEDGVLQFLPPSPKPFREAVERFLVLDNRGLNEGLGSFEEQLPTALRSGHRADGAHLRDVFDDFREHLSLVHPSPLPRSLVLIYRRPVGGRQEGVNLVFLLVDCQCVGSFLRRHGFEELQAPRVEDINHSRVADGDVDMAQRRVEENDVRRAAELPNQPDLARVYVDRNQLSSVTGAEELSPAPVEVEAMGSLSGNLVGLANS